MSQVTKDGHSPEEEIKFHQRRIELCKRAIDGDKAKIELFDLYNEVNPMGNLFQVDEILKTIGGLESEIEEYKRLIKNSEQFIRK